MTQPVIQTGKRIASGVAVALLVGCTAVPIAPRPVYAQEVYSDADSQLFYELLVSELAIRRGELAVAAEGYLRASERTDDPRVAERATQLAIYYQQWDTAETTATRWLSLDPDAVGAYESLAQIHLRQGNAENAAEALAGWIDATDRDAETFHAISQLLQRDPKMEMSFTVANELAKRFPTESLAQVGKARMAINLNQREVALAAANDALALDSGSVDALLVKAQAQISLGLSPDAVVTLQEAVTRQPDSLPLHLGFAQLLVESGLYDRAGPVMERAAELSGDDPDTLMRLGLLALTALRNEQAKTYLSGVLKANPYSPRAHFYLARIADRSHDYETALGHYDSVPEGDFYLTSSIRAAEITAQSGNVDDGLDRIRSLLPRIDDAGMRVELLSAESRILQQADRYKEAIDGLSSALESYPDNPELLYARALAYEKNGENAEFEGDLGRLLEKDPNNAHALNALGYHLVVNNTRLDEAESHLELAYALEPEDAAIMDSLGWLRFRQERLEEAKSLDEAGARSLWDKALVDAPDHKVLNDVIDRFVTK